MTNPYMFEPSQLSNQFSNYNDQAMPWPPTYNTGAGGPVNAATGQPIQSFQQWQQQNPGGMSLNATPAAPAAPQQQATQNPSATDYSTSNPALANWYKGHPPGSQMTAGGQLPSGQNYGSAVPVNVPPTMMPGIYGQAQAAAPQQAVGPQASGAPNNWQAAINALANPGKVTTPGATVPLQSGTQPAGGVNQAWLQGIGSGQGMNQNFVNALRGIQNR
jgi:hypothetical protein